MSTLKHMFLVTFSLALLSSCMTKSVMINGEKVELNDGIYAKMVTSKGDILIQLEVENAPMTSANFIALSEGNHPDVKEEYKNKPFYDGLTFHRVIPGFMIQGGDPQGNGSGEPGYRFPNEISDSLTHLRGVISMANSGPNTNGCQFFITVKETPFLDGGYNVFGKVLEGQNVADTISLVPRNDRDKPNTDVTINTVEIIRVGSMYKDWDAPAAFAKGKTDFEEKERKFKEEAAARAQAQMDAIKAKFPGAETSSTGLMYYIEDVGSGVKPADGDMVNINYTGYLPDGTMFDSSIEERAQEGGVYNPQRPYEPMPMEYGMQAQVIPGFKEGVSMLNVGGKATLIIPPYLGYGDRGAGNVIPPDSWLIFEVEIVSKQ